MSIKLVARSIFSNPGNKGQKLTRLCRAFLWQGWKRTFSRTIRIKLSNGRRFVAHPDCVVSSALIYTAWPEYHELQFLRRVLSKGDIMIDVGANVGHIGLLLSDIVLPSDIIAFEPTPVTFGRLRQNWVENDFPTEGLHNVAVGREASFVFFPNPSHPDTTNRQLPSDCKTSDVCKTKVLTLDSLRSRWLNGRIGLLKIDVEGFELDVLRGALETLRTDRPRVIMFESLGGKVNSEIESLFESVDFRLFQLNKCGEIDLSETSAQNVFACPREFFQDIQDAFNSN